MIAADVLRFLSLASVPLLGSLGLLTLAQLYIVGAVNAAGQIAFQAASQAHLKPWSAGTGSSTPTAGSSRPSGCRSPSDRQWAAC
jgi:hypothetical protein